MITPPERNRLRAQLETDRAWCAYALADLDPRQDQWTEWHRSSSAVLLVYRGVQPPILFAHGEPAATELLLAQVPPGEYQFALLGAHHALWTAKPREEAAVETAQARHPHRPRLEVSRESRMWRMILPASGFPSGETGGCVRLTQADLGRMRSLWDSSPDRPDSFTTSQLADGVFYGVEEGSELAAVAGTHIVSPWAGVAAIGNVFTRADRRGRGYGRRATAAVVEELLAGKIGTIVLNVGMENSPAIRVYRRLGFLPFCGYYEGLGRLIP